MSESIATNTDVTLVGTYNDAYVEYVGDKVEIGLLVVHSTNNEWVTMRTHEMDKASTVNLTPDEALRMADDLKALAISMGAKA
ncbi:hypothetical protein NVP3058O_058 [Vibrio phage 3.058.O._10N.286.46.B8]|nr:hypothetical protein NVP2058O_059 [Vibrio phage 2.058.O._10N.286.46.B8]AUS03128.1 hypothetical protein NVP3058O_058 [Vibrio phage 3.058.O._10N.286.46.B8]